MGIVEILNFLTSNQQIFTVFSILILGKTSNVTQRSCLLYYNGIRNKKEIMIKRKKGEEYHEWGFTE